VAVTSVLVPLFRYWPEAGAGVPGLRPLPLFGIAITSLRLSRIVRISTDRPPGYRPYQGMVKRDTRRPPARQPTNRSTGHADSRAGSLAVRPAPLSPAGLACTAATLWLQKASTSSALVPMCTPGGSGAAAAHPSSPRQDRQPIRWRTPDRRTRGADLAPPARQGRIGETGQADAMVFGRAPVIRSGGRCRRMRLRSPAAGAGAPTRCSALAQRGWRRQKGRGARNGLCKVASPTVPGRVNTTLVRLGPSSLDRPGRTRSSE
jgi:hypothetical protein